MSLMKQKVLKIDKTKRELLKMVEEAKNGTLLSSDLFDVFVTPDRNKRHIQLAIRQLEGKGKNGGQALITKMGCLRDGRKYWLRMV